MSALSERGGASPPLDAAEHPREDQEAEATPDEAGRGVAHAGHAVAEDEHGRPDDRAHDEHQRRRQ
ncbi:hypothetical protein GCM10009721_09070 [Terrabacter tumescens]|uniref:Uncharacterized protein n=1 Tax=Terrabacter tumescens TaxID=60443 RepID=A0ABQ2HNQ7_9MICO|nr:hypothetical protein [Terrabacter tumescens]GGM86468.1 hypothetical protein GCM10009721_09070 [Terrabacter tumescens]